MMVWWCKFKPDMEEASKPPSERFPGHLFKFILMPAAILYALHVEALRSSLGKKSSTARRNMKECLGCGILILLSNYCGVNVASDIKD